MRKLVTTLAFLLFPTVALAADKIETSFGQGTFEGVATSTVSFEFSDCEEECHLASLTCDANNHITLDLADVPTEDVIKAMRRYQHQIVLQVGKKGYDFNIRKMSFAELTVAWSIDADLFATAGPTLPEALATASRFELKTAKTSPTTVLVDDNVRSWAKACKWAN